MSCFPILKKKRKAFYVQSVDTIRISPKEIGFKLTDGVSEPHCCKMVLCSEPDYVRFIIDTDENNVDKSSAKIDISCEQLDVTKESQYLLVNNSKISVKMRYNPWHVSVYHRSRVVCVCKIMLDKERDGQVCFVTEMIGVSSVYGVPERACVSRLVCGQQYRLYNTDEFGLAQGTNKPLYGSVPYTVSVCSDHCVGVLCWNESDTVLRLTRPRRRLIQRLSRQYWSHDIGTIDVMCFPANDGLALRQSLLRITGTTPLPPLFALGYHQCRWNYDDQEDVIKVDKGLRDAGIPCDVLWLDIEHTDDKRYFTWNKDKFDPVALIDYLTKKGMHLVVIIDPHLKVDTDYQIYREARDAGYLVKDEDEETVFIGECWPGNSCWVDYISNDGSAWWTDKICEYMKEYGANGQRNHLWIWNDMNEPSVFKYPNNQMKPTAMHANGVKHRQIHNIYGQRMAMATWNGILKATDGNLRPFLLSRSFFSGSQKYGAIWTGDSVCSWDHLRISVSMILSLSICGIDFCGSDVGGFYGDPPPELLCRWYQLGAFQPFFRAHAHIESQRREPYLIEEPYKNAIKNAIGRRYELLAYWYLCFWQAETELLPIVSPVWMQFPQNQCWDNNDDSYMIGSALLVRPVVSSLCLSITAFLPGTKDDLWYQYCHVSSRWQIRRAAVKLKIPVNIESIPIFYRAGHCIFTKEGTYSNTAEWQEASYNILLFPNTHGSCSGQLYVDDYRSFAYRNKGEYYLYRCTLDLREGSLSFETIHSSSTIARSEASGKIVRVTIIKNGFHSVSECKCLSMNNEDCMIEQFSDRMEISNIHVGLSSNWTMRLR